MDKEYIQAGSAFCNIHSAKKGVGDSGGLKVCFAWHIWQKRNKDSGKL